MSFKSPLLIEQHIHGAFGVDFNKCQLEDVLFVADKLLERGIGGFFPTLVTDSIENINQQIGIIKKAAEICPRILGIHLEGIFINPQKKGIHNPKHFLALTVENYKLIENDFIKIVTLAPELDEGLIEYLKNKNIKVQAGHSMGWGNVNGVTHLFNAMAPITHRGTSTSLSALINDNVYTEIIADGVHVSNEALELVFKSKSKDKIILISDSLPITDSNLKETVFADSKIFYDGIKATSEDNTIAGSTMLLDKIVTRLISLNLFDKQFIENPYKYHDIKPFGEIRWSEFGDIEEIQLYKT